MSQLTAADFLNYATTDYSTIEAGPLALYAVSLDSIAPTQMNEGYVEVDTKAAGYDLDTTAAELQADLLTDVEPVVIGPGGQLYLLDGHHTFTALANSVWGSTNPTVYVNIIANYSGLSESAFFATMQSNNFLLPLNNGVPETVNDATGSPIPTSLTGLTNDPYRSLEYEILKNKDSKLFTGDPAIPGLDKMPGLYSDFFEAAAYQNANGGLGLAYLSPGDIATSTNWNLAAGSTTTLPNVSGTVTAEQLPGFILAQNILVSTVVSDATVSTGALSGNATPTFNGITEINAGTLANPIMIGTPNTGFVMQVGSDKGFAVTLSNDANTYDSGTTLLAGHLIVDSDGSLGHGTTETLAQFNAAMAAAVDTEGLPDNVANLVQQDNGIIFNSLSEGNATLTLGTTAGEYTAANPFVTSRPIAVGNEAATIDVYDNVVDLNGPLVSLGYDGLGIGETTGFPSLTIDDLSTNGTKTPPQGTLVLSTLSPYFYGDIIIGNSGSPTVEVMSDGALGNTGNLTNGTGSSSNVLTIGEVELNKGTLQAGASFTATERNIVLDSSSAFDVNGFTTSWGSLTDIQRALTVENSSTTSAGAVTFASFTIGATATLALTGNTEGETVTFTNGITRDANATLFISPTTAGDALGGTLNKVFSTTAPTLVDGVVAPWMITDNEVTGANGYDFLTYGTNGYVVATYANAIGSAAGTGAVELATGANTLTSSGFAYALKLDNSATLAISSGKTLTLGDGTHAAGLILSGSSSHVSSISGGTLAFGGSEAIIYSRGTDGSSIASTITGSNGLTLAGAGTLTISSVASLSGLITVDSGTLILSKANVFSTDTAGLLLEDVKGNPAPAGLTASTNQAFTTLDSAGNNSTITIKSSSILTIGDTTNNLSSTISSTITETGSATSGALTFAGSGLFDLTGMSSGTLSLISGSSIAVTGTGDLRVVANIFAASNFAINLAANSQLQFAQNGGGQFANAVTGAGELHLIGGILQITGTANTYTGGTVVETGSTLDITTANLPTTNENITDAGGLIVFDQTGTTSGTYTGVISDGKEMGTGPMESGSLDKDDSSGANSGNVILSNVQTYTGATYVEAGTLTLGATNTVADSSGVTLGRVGGAGGTIPTTNGGATAILALGANNQLSSLSNDADNTTLVQLNGHQLTLAPTSGTNSDFSGVIGDGSSAGSVVVGGAGTVTLAGANTYSGGTTVDTGSTLAIGAADNIGTGALTLDVGSTVDLTAGFTLTQAITATGDPTFDVTTGQTNTVTGLISDGTAPGIVEVTGGGTLDLDNAANSYSGGTTITDGSTLEIGVAGSAGTGSIAFSGTGDTLKIDGTTVPTNTITGIVNGDSIDLSGIAYDSAGTATVITGNVLQIVENGHTYDMQLDPAQNYTGEFFNMAPDTGGSGTMITEDSTACYCRGTMILTARGEIAVEDLSIGDRLITASGKARPIRWIGTRSYSGRFATGNRNILPIVIHEGALGENVPKRDLWVSPLHAMFLDGVLIPASALVNGITIVQATRIDLIEYFHLELESHDVIVAEGSLSESFLDDDSRGMFHNATTYRDIYPDAVRAPARYCAPRVEDGAALQAVRNRIQARANANWFAAEIKARA